jgi:type IV pilus assembly protein PilA
MMKKLKSNKGFSLIELLVVIAIIGVLSAVGITAYTGYTATAKEQASRAQFAQLVSLTNAEMAKCGLGTGSYAWTGACSAGVVASTDADIVTYLTGTLGMKSPYDQTSTTGTVQTAAAYAYSLAAPADPTEAGDITIYCNATTGTVSGVPSKACNIRLNPGNSATVLTSTISAAS